VSDTETRDEPMTEVEVDALLADARRHLRAGTGCGSCVKGVERLASSLATARDEVERLQAQIKRWDDVLLEKANRHQAERDEAEAESARLRGVVEAVQALADEWSRHSRALLAGGMRGSIPYTDAARRLDAVLWSVPSSGETGERQKIDRHRLTTEEHSTYQALRARGVSHEDAMSDALDGVSVETARTVPASPEPTGADEAVRAVADVALAEDFVDAVLDTVVSPEVGAIGLTVGDVVTIARWLAPVAIACASVVAARPVLSREALRERLGTHWPITPVQCECGWREEGPDDGYLDHLAAVLDTQEAGQ
jgi:hypothetical protein